MKDYAKSYDSTKSQYTYTYSGANKITHVSFTDSTLDFSGRGLPTSKSKGVLAGNPSESEFYWYDTSGKMTYRRVARFDESGTKQQELDYSLAYDKHGQMTASSQIGTSTPLSIP